MVAGSVPYIENSEVEENRLQQEAGSRRGILFGRLTDKRKRVESALSFRHRTESEKEWFDFKTQEAHRRVRRNHLAPKPPRQWLLTGAVDGYHNQTKPACTLNEQRPCVETSPAPERLPLNHRALQK